MNCTACISADTLFDALLFQNEMVPTENIYATELVPAIRKPTYQPFDEEELHTSFEEAISDRQLAIHGRLSRLSNPMPVVQDAERNTDAVFSASAWNTAFAKISTQIMPLASKRTTIFACSAIMFVLLGFDLMGLLMLHLH